MCIKCVKGDIAKTLQETLERNSYFSDVNADSIRDAFEEALEENMTVSTMISGGRQAPIRFTDGVSNLNGLIGYAKSVDGHLELRIPLSNPGEFANTICTIAVLPDAEEIDDTVECVDCGRKVTNWVRCTICEGPLCDACDTQEKRDKNDEEPMCNGCRVLKEMGERD